MPRVAFRIRRQPKPKQSARFMPFVKAEKDVSASGLTELGVRSYQPKPVTEHAAIIRQDISAAWADRPALRGPVGLIVVHRYPWPKSMPKWKRALAWFYGRKVTRPDLENLDKMLKDALEGIVYWNDCQVWRAVSTKRYHDGPASTEVVVYWQAEPERPAVKGGSV